MPYIGTCFRFYTKMWVKKKHLHIEFIVTSHNSVEKSAYNCYIFLFSIQGPWELPTALACIHYEINQELSKLSENKCGQWINI